MIVDGAMPGLIADLLAAAGRIDRISMPERARLLERAANALRDYRYGINYSDTPANDNGRDDITTQWMALAANVEDYPNGAVAAVLLDAAESVRAATVLMDAKRAILRDAEPEGRA